MHRTKKILSMLAAFLLIFSLSGCSNAFVKKIGTNRYEINALRGGITSPDDNFATKAREICPGGYRVIERHSTNTVEMYGTIECE